MAKGCGHPIIHEMKPAYHTRQGVCECLSVCGKIITRSTTIRKLGWKTACFTVFQLDIKNVCVY